MGETMTPDEAVRVLDEARGYEEPLLRRTEGLTWMIWGLATPGVFLSYAFASVVDAPGWVFNVLWAPWIAVAVLTTAALWRSAALVFPSERARPSGAFWVRFVGFSAALSVLFYILGPEGPEIPLMIVGAMWSGMGILNVWKSDPSGRVVAVAAGGPLLVAGAAFALLGTPVEVSGTAAVVLSGLAPFLAGAWRAFRG